MVPTDRRHDMSRVTLTGLCLGLTSSSMGWRHDLTHVTLIGLWLGLTSSPTGWHGMTCFITGLCLGGGWEGTSPVGLRPDRPLLARYSSSIHLILSFGNTLYYVGTHLVHYPIVL
jgi:hypothetical protein